MTSLQWGVKQSFLNYLAGLPDGRAAVSPGVTALDDRAVIFPAEPDRVGDSEPGESVLRFSGEVRFGGHGGLLFVRIADPWLHLRGHEGEMTVSDPFLTEAPGRVALVTFNVPAMTGPGPWTADEVRLTEAGSDIFNEVYEPRTLFDPLVLIG